MQCISFRWELLNSAKAIESAEEQKKRKKIGDGYSIQNGLNLLFI